MPNSTVPAADEGLPNSGQKAGLKDSPGGWLSVGRENAVGITPLGMSANDLSEFLALLDAHNSAESAVEVARNVWHERTKGLHYPNPIVVTEREKFDARFDGARGLRLAAKNLRTLQAHLKTIAAMAPKGVDDLLFKAYVAEATEERTTVLNSLSYAIVRDLLASDCWRA